MGSISKLANGKYRARYRDLDGVQRAKHFERKVEAEIWLTGIEATKLDGTYVSPDAGRQTFGAYAADWVSRQVHRPSTRAQVGSHMKNHILPAFENRQLSSIRPSEIQTFVKSLTVKLAPATVEVIYRYLASIFLSAIDDRVLARTPCRGVKLPKSERRLVHPLTSDQVLAIVDSVPDRYKALVFCTAGTGLRQGEAFGLTVGHLDFFRKQIRVEQQLVFIVGEPEFGPPKTLASRRVIPIPRMVVDSLAEHLATFGAGENDLVFTDDDGHALRRNRFSAKVWRPGLSAIEVPAGTVFHDLRHYYASLLIHAGESVKVVQARLGHASAMETLDTYGHLWPDSEDRTREAIETAFGGAVFSAIEDSLRTVSNRLKRFPQAIVVVTVSRPVGGILSGSRRSLGGHPSERSTWGVLPLRRRASSPCPTLDLAPGGVYRAGGVTPVAGALLPHPFTLTCADPGARHRRFPFCGTVLRVAPTGR